MICANGINPRRPGRPAGRFQLRQSIQLLKIGMVSDHDQYQCPNCKAKFLFPQDPTAEQIPLIPTRTLCHV